MKIGMLVTVAQAYAVEIEIQASRIHDFVKDGVRVACNLTLGDKFKSATPSVSTFHWPLFTLLVPTLESRAQTLYSSSLDEQLTLPDFMFLLCPQQICKRQPNL